MQHSDADPGRNRRSGDWLRLEYSHLPSRFGRGQYHEIARPYPLRRQGLAVIEHLLIVFHGVDHLQIDKPSGE